MLFDSIVITPMEKQYQSSWDSSKELGNLFWLFWSQFSEVRKHRNPSQYKTRTSDIKWNKKDKFQKKILVRNY